MLDKQDIIARLQDGDTMDQIVEEITDVVNAAANEYEQIQEEAKMDIEAARLENAKREAVCMMVDGLCDYLVAVGDNELLEEIHKITVGDLVNTVDTIYNMSKTIKELEVNNFFGLF